MLVQNREIRIDGPCGAGFHVPAEVMVKSILDLDATKFAAEIVDAQTACREQLAAAKPTGPILDAIIALLPTLLPIVLPLILNSFATPKVDPVAP